ncbi:MAG: hypothetical protein LBO69_04665 [Ignavibacteria bacterium]|jgi:hypothetical protein|nr:hypothetical protein [Ignavibacteria bacterium]
MQKINLKLGYILIAVMLTAFAGCGAGYAPKGDYSESGYSETFYSPDRGTVYFYGQTNATYEKVNDLALLRAAELALQGHYTYFVVVESKDITKQVVTTTAGRSERVESTSEKNGREVRKTEQSYVPASTNVNNKPAVALEVQFYTAKPSSVFVYDANFIYSSLRQKYGIKD